MFCTNCGGEMAAEARFCSRCGKSTVNGSAPYEAGAAVATSAMMKRPVVIMLLAILNLLGGGLLLLGGLAGVISIVTGPSTSAEDFVILAILVAIGLLAFAAGVGLLQMREYGRMIQMGLSIFGLLAIPVGTIVSALILYYLTRPGTKVLFSGKLAEELTPEERNAVLQLQQSAGSGVLVAVVIFFMFVAMTGILAAIAVPNLLTAMQRSKQKRTMADIRTIATAWEAYATDNNTYLPQGLDRSEYGSSGAGLTAYGNGDVMPLPSVRLDANDLERVLSPTYVRAMPRLDGWSREIELYLDGGGQEYLIRALGKDGVAEDNYDVGPFRSFDCDVVYSMGTFVAYPESVLRSDP